ncbi:protein penguin [Pieris rapae]|uniref:protein penguin n=1 Tax=Pieris rapae TaxID=64459 RepID=UPI001E27EEAD|nr:protein penguin [Pieris rapae]
MQKVKRKAAENGDSPAKKKKVQFDESKPDKVQDFNIKKGKGGFKKNEKKEFGKDKAMKPNKLHPKIQKEKPAFVKGKAFDKSKPSFSKTKPGFKKDFKGKISKDGDQKEKPKWSEMKKEKKTLRLERRKAKATVEIFEISHKAKLLSAQIQRKVVKQDFRDNSCNELHGLLKNQYKSIALTHDLSRVIQVLLKYGSEEIKKDITQEVMDIMVPMMQSKYAHHSVKRILKYGTDSIRHQVISKLYGNIVSLATHTISAPVLDFAYGEFASKKEKTYMQQEFYGDMYKNTKDDKVKTLSDTYKDSPEMKSAILQSCKANIQKILDKNLHDGELLHSVLYDYIRECSTEDRADLISTLSPLIVPLSNSMPGVNAASICVWQGTNKDKKNILKVVKEHVVPLSKHKTGYRLLIAIFDSVDDTVLVRKTIVSTMASNLKDIAKDHWGNMTLHWLVKPKDPAAFHPSFIKFLEEGLKSGTSKKDTEIRITELREAIMPDLQKHMVEDPEFWLSNKSALLLAIAVLSIESSQDVFEALVRVICRSDWKITVNDKEVLAIEDPGIHMCLKKLALLDKSDSKCKMGEAISECIQDETLEVWLPTNRGCFFLLKLIENNGETVANKLKKKISSHKNTLKKQSSEGAKLLLQSLGNK